MRTLFAFLTILFFHHNVFSQAADSLLVGEWRIDKINMNGTIVFDAEHPEIFIANYQKRQLRGPEDDSASLYKKAQEAFKVMSQDFLLFTSGNGLKSGTFHEDRTGARLQTYNGSYQTDGQRLRITLFQERATNEEYTFELDGDLLILRSKSNKSGYLHYKRVMN